MLIWLLTDHLKELGEGIKVNSSSHLEHVFMHVLFLDGDGIYDGIVGDLQAERFELIKSWTLASFLTLYF